MNLWVVMGNDYPEAVFSTEQAAMAYCQKKTDEEHLRAKYQAPRIYWRSYDFVLDAKS